MQRRVAIVVLCKHIGTVVKQRFHAVPLVEPHRVVDGRVVRLAIYCGLGVGIRTVQDQELHCPCVAVPCCHVDRLQLPNATAVADQRLRANVCLLLRKELHTLVGLLLSCIAALLAKGSSMDGLRAHLPHLVLQRFLIQIIGLNLVSMLGAFLERTLHLVRVAHLGGAPQVVVPAPPCPLVIVILDGLTHHLENLSAYPWMLLWSHLRDER
mmetsp:Transcript_71667/g.171145  ORF Transcript_71667/g.171145 Transcript_71667/m.171145 type:complete len:211 (-) Transcript_71667:195-827(-)